MIAIAVLALAANISCLVLIYRRRHAGGGAGRDDVNDDGLRRRRAIGEHHVREAQRLRNDQGRAERGAKTRVEQVGHLDPANLAGLLGCLKTARGDGLADGVHSRQTGIGT